MLQRNTMLNDRGNEILALASKVTVKEIGHQLYPDGSTTAFEREIVLNKDTRIDLIDWQCRTINIEGEVYTEVVQAKSEHGPMNFAYLALSDSNGAVIEKTMWTEDEIEVSEARFAMKAFLRD